MPARRGRFPRSCGTCFPPACGQRLKGRLVVFFLDCILEVYPKRPDETFGLKGLEVARRVDRLGQRLVDQRTYSANSTLTDSAAAASAWATGEKFANGEISFNTNKKRSVRTILELAKQHGKATGLVTTKAVTDATPAAFGAHVFSRDCQNEIARQYLKETRVDVLMGGGVSKFSAKTADDPLECPTYGGDLLGEAIKGGYALVRTDVQMEKALGQNPARLLGLFATGNMTKESEKAEESAEPSLEGMTTAALSILQDDPEGFFLLVEGAQIDTTNHDNDYAGQLGEVLAFERTSKAVLEWLEKDPGRKAETLLILTSSPA